MGARRSTIVPTRIPGRPLLGTWAGGVRPARRLVGALIGILLAYMMVMTVSAQAVELEEFTWSAAGVPAFSTWSDPLNWASDTAPSPFSTVGRLSFPAQESSTCALHGGGEECYLNENNVPGIAAEALSIDDGYSYRIKGEPITLGAGGLTATTSATAQGLASLYFPIVLGSSQTWAIDGNNDHGGLAIDNSVTGTAPLEVKVTGGAYFEPENIETGAITISGDGLVSLATHHAGEGLNGTDGNPVTLKGATIDGVNGTVGPLTSIGGLLYLTAQSVTALSVAGELTLDSGSSVQVNLQQDVNAELGYGRVEATGNMNLGGARFVGIEATTNYGECPRLNPGDVYTLVKSDSSLKGTFAGTPNGTVLSLYCGGGVSPTVRINYTSHAVTATAVTSGGPLRPASISPPSISGSTFRGQTLTAVPGTWTGSPTAFGYEWERCRIPEGHVVCFPITEAGGETYTLQASDIGYQMRVREVAENSYGVGVPAYSALSAVIAEPVPVPSLVSRPSIQGNAVVGQTLTEVHGLWMGSPTSYAYLWERCEREQHCSAIPGATGQTYGVRIADVGYTIVMQETAYNAGGPSSPASSGETGIVYAPPPPSLVSRPSIQGNAVVGQTLTEVHGSWMGSPTSYGYLWERCEREQRCSAIPGATGQTYAIQAADVGYTIVVQEIASNANGASAPASSPETGIVLPLAGSGGGGGNGGGGSSGGGNSPPQAPDVSSVSSPIGGTKLPGGPVAGGTQLTITGSGFVPGATQVWIEPYGEPATSVVVQSSTQLIAVTPQVTMTVAGKHTIRVNTPAGSSSTTASAANSFYYYVPQIGTLVFRDPSLPPSNKDYHSYCTASVVASSNKDVISTAGHCITSGTTWHDEVVFAPGFYGPTCPNFTHAEEALSCGIGPYSFWHSRGLVANQAFMTRRPTPEGLDFGFIAAQTEGGKHIEEVVGGGLPIEFCAGTLAPLHLFCEAGAGATEHNWVAFGQPSPAAGLVHCGPLATITAKPEPNGPENLFVEPCVAVTSGSSGGPWINLGGHVGAVNQTHCGPDAGDDPCPGNPETTITTGTYFTREAEEAFDTAQRGTASAALMSVIRQDAVVSKSGTVAVPVSCPGPGNCRGTALLGVQGPAAVSANVKNTKSRVKHATILLGRAHFAIHAGKTAMVRFRIMRHLLSRLWPSHTRRGHGVVLSTLTLRTTQSVTEVLVTLSR